MAEQCRNMAIRLCLPSAALGFAALVAFMCHIEERYRWTFYRRDSRKGMYRRNWQQLPDDEDGDAYRAKELMKNILWEQHCSDLVDAWLVRHADAWKTKPPAWLTPEWRHAVQPLLLRQPRAIAAMLQGSQSSAARESGTHSPARKPPNQLVATTFKMQQPMWLMPIHVFMRLAKLESHEEHQRRGDLVQWDVSMRHVFYISQEARPFSSDRFISLGPSPPSSPPCTDHTLCTRLARSGLPRSTPITRAPSWERCSRCLLGRSVVS